MDFVLGIFTGMSLIITLGIYLNYKDQKRKEAAHKQRLEAVRSMWQAFRITPEDMRYLNHSDELNPYQSPLSPSEMLKRAIENEDFEEAARLRDLINKR